MGRFFEAAMAPPSKNHAFIVLAQILFFAFFANRPCSFAHPHKPVGMWHIDTLRFSALICQKSGAIFRLPTEYCTCSADVKMQFATSALMGGMLIPAALPMKRWTWLSSPCTSLPPSCVFSPFPLPVGAPRHHRPLARRLHGL